jgi:hypothetical protein
MTDSHKTFLLFSKKKIYNILEQKQELIAKCTVVIHMNKLTHEYRTESMVRQVITKLLLYQSLTLRTKQYIRIF